MNRFLLFVPCAGLLCSCVTPRLAEPKVGLPGLAITADHQGYKLTQTRYEYEISHGAEAKFFIARNDKAYPWYLDGQNEPFVGIEMAKFRNKTP